MAIKDQVGLNQWGLLQQKIWESIDRKSDNECWPWKPAVFGDGYGRLQFACVRLQAHRVVYEIVNHSIPGNKVVMHSCDNPRCCNPSHLKLGTNRDNIDDMIQKKRGSVKLDKDQVEAIKSDKRRQWMIAKDYGVTQSLISLIKSGRRWA